MTDNLTSFSEQSQEENYLHELRPKLFEDFSGQQSVVDNLKIFVEAANQRNQALDHVLLLGILFSDDVAWTNILKHGPSTT